MKEPADKYYDYQQISKISRYKISTQKLFGFLFIGNKIQKLKT